MTHLLLDTDILLYKAASSAEQEVDWGDDVWSLFTDLNDAKKSFQYQVEQIYEATKSKEATFCMTDHSGNFRKEVDPSYKSNRKGSRKPVGYVALCNWVRDTYKTITKPMLEADDCMGILATKPENIGKCIIVSDDKDMRTVPSRIFRPMSGEFIDVTEQDADRFFLTQCLMGDPTDGITGLKGVGAKTAEKILGLRPHWSLVEQAYMKAGHSRDDAIQQARLVRILRWTDWDADKETVKLWKPN